MQKKSITTAALATLFFGATLSVYAAPDTNTMSETKAAETTTQKPAAKKAKPHSHMEEKTGVAAKAPEAPQDKPKADNDKSKHYHPRDGK